MMTLLTILACFQLMALVLARRGRDLLVGSLRRRLANLLGLAAIQHAPAPATSLPPARIAPLARVLNERDPGRRRFPPPPPDDFPQLLPPPLHDYSRDPVILAEEAGNPDGRYDPVQAAGIVAMEATIAAADEESLPAAAALIRHLQTTHRNDAVLVTHLNTILTLIQRVKFVPYRSKG
jgi:hypothetical protein